jgi:alpha-glucosidase
VRRIARLSAAPLALALALASAQPAPAAAAVSLGQAVITVGTARATAVITRDPFRLEVLAADRKVVLGEVPGDVSKVAVEPPTADPVAPGYDNPSTTTLYAPLSFLVGSEAVQQYPGLVWGGDLESGLRSGVLYAAERVIDARRAGDGARLVVSTSDPAGRILMVDVEPLGAAAISVKASADPATGVAELGDSFGSGPGEAFYGFGGRHDLIDQHGQVFSSFVEEENVDGPGGQPATGPLSLFPNGPPAAYYPQAQLISTRRYGFLLDQPQLARFKLDADRSNAWNVTASAPQLDYVVAPGAPSQAIATLTSLTGRQPVPPRWALGPMLDRLVKNVGESQADYEANVSSDLQNIARYRLPLTAYRLEGWGFGSAGNDGFALPTQVTPQFQAETFARLRRMGIHPLVYMRSFISPGSAPVKERLVARTASGQPYYTTTSTGSPIALLDFTNPSAVRFWQAEVRKALDLGADGFMQDYGEQVQFDMHFADGETGVTMHNRYPILYAQATRQAFAAYERRHPRRTLFFFTRAGYSGLPGSAAYEGGNFPGDESTDWTHTSGLASSTPDMLNRAVGGAYGYGTDIGGYFDYTSPPTTKDLFLRWAEWAALTPVFRLHGSGRSGTHTPWSYDAQTVQTYIALSRLHLEAVPLILRLWKLADRTGIPITRPLWLQYPGDPQARDQDQEWLLGPDVLVAPVVTQGANARAVYFPPGCWRAASARAVYRGPEEKTVSAPLTKLPYFFKCGTTPFSTATAHRGPRLRRHRRRPPRRRVAFTG